MVQLPSSGKRHAEPAEAARRAAAAAVKLEVEELGADDRGPLSKRAKAAQPTPPTPPQQQQVDPELPYFCPKFCVLDWDWD